METDMAAIVLKGTPAELRRRLELRARASGRSVSGEVIACLEGVVGTEPPRRTADEVRQLIEAARAVREELAAKGFSITDEEITAWKRQGRP
jgi:plasmid stability protein